jgi:hypothetical protein
VVRVLLASFFERLGAHLGGAQGGNAFAQRLREWAAMLRLLVGRR